MKLPLNISALAGDDLWVPPSYVIKIRVHFAKHNYYHFVLWSEKLLKVKSLTMVVL